MKLFSSITMMLFFMALFTAGCGKLGTVEHNGQIAAKVQIDESMLNGYFARHCCKVALSALGPTPTDQAIADCAREPSAPILECAKNWTADFLAAMTSMVPTTTNVADHL